jgi:serine/threonine protein kinase
MGATAAVHPTDQTLQSYGLGTLDDASVESVKKHLEACSNCRHRVADLSSARLLIGLQDDLGPPDSTAPVVSSLTGPSWMCGESSSGAPPPASFLPPGLAAHPDYEVLRELGQGGMGTVYLARNRLMGRQEVLKVVSSHLMNRRGVLDRFLSEIRNAARLRHTNIVTAFSATRTDESIIFAMEYVEGLDLSRLVRSKGQQPVAHACNLVHQAALGLQHAHEQGMVHRDIKPSNLMLASQGNRAVIKVLDFGLAKIQSEGAVDGGLTHEGQMLGTPDYIAPEQITDARRADIRADIYSLGCTLYFLLTGGPPFRATSLYDLLQAHRSMVAMPLNLVRPDVPVEVAAIVAKMMAKEPECRFRTPAEVAKSLAPFFKKGITGPTESNTEIPRKGEPDERPESPRQRSIWPRYTVLSALGLKKPPGSVHPEAQWKSLVDVGQTDSQDEPRILHAWPNRSNSSWIWPTAAAALLLLGLYFAWPVDLRDKTVNGMIELVDLPKDAEVLLDGAEVAVTWPGDGKPPVIPVTAGRHKILVKKDGLEVSGDEVSVPSEGKARFDVGLIPDVDLHPKNGDADDFARHFDVAKSSTPLAATDVPKPEARLAVSRSPVESRASVLKGNWAIEGDELVQSKKEFFDELLFTNSNWPEYDLTLEAKYENSPRVPGPEHTTRPGCGVFFHRQDPASFCRFTGDVYGYGAQYMVNGKNFPAWNQAPTVFKPGVWHSLRLEVRQNSIKCFIDQDIRFSDSNPRLNRGSVGLTSKFTVARFRRIKVTDPGGKVLFEGPPTLDTMRLPPASRPSG